MGDRIDVLWAKTGLTQHTTDERSNATVRWRAATRHEQLPRHGREAIETRAQAVVLAYETGLVQPGMPAPNG
jgi:hypothetical protein